MCVPTLRRISHPFDRVSLTFFILSGGAASEKCQQEKRKTVNGEDILFAMSSLGFENYAEALKIYLSKYREVSSRSFLLFALRRPLSALMMRPAKGGPTTRAL